MFEKNFKIALLVSLSAHIIGFSSLAIVMPAHFNMRKPFTKVTFLGPLLNKTAFDIMLDNIRPDFKITYEQAMMTDKNGYLDVSVAKYEARVASLPGHYEAKADNHVMAMLKGAKIVPDVGAGERYSRQSSTLKGPMTDPDRKVLYMPPMPQILKGTYGDKDTFNFRFKVLIDPDGNVKTAEPLTTSGYPRLDMTAAKYVKGWLFEPVSSPGKGDQWKDIDVTISTGE